MYVQRGNAKFEGVIFCLFVLIFYVSVNFADSAAMHNNNLETVTFISFCIFDQCGYCG